MVTSIVRGGYNHIQLPQKCIDPFARVAARLRRDAYLFIAKSVGPESVLPEAEQLARFQIDEAIDPLWEGITFGIPRAEQQHDVLLAGIEEPRDRVC